jgi:hypothetical protein
MVDGHTARHARVVDSIAAMPKVESTEVSQRPVWWWILIMPGKVILWIEYMFPRRVGGVFGSARRRNVPLIQFLYSLYFYGFVVLIGLFVFYAARAR